MLAAQRIELGGDLAVATQRQLSTGAILERQQPELLESGSRGQQHLRVIEPGERRTPPQPQRCAAATPQPHAGSSASSRRPWLMSVSNSSESSDELSTRTT